MSRSPRITAIYRAADAILRGEDPASAIAEIDGLTESARETAVYVAERITEIPRWHAERIARLPTLARRRLALGELHPDLRRNVERYLLTIWERRKRRA